ncbi:hypothetical protein QYF61_013235 [Mycteria americana]|uniref:Uncharacterized protein n=1 Tax=Mycteria americana TaxID=33587 RepID=A0AAN7NLG8_MYCAM|nr:hypothetical protein QYF61_013235 [Mycteria americana]
MKSALRKVRVDGCKELMTKLITETPDQPIPFLIDHLQSKQGNRSQLQRTLSGSAALWAESETSEKGKHHINFEEGQEGDFGDYKLISLTSLSGKVIEQIFLEGVPATRRRKM